jgi:hypothetical protein
MAINHIQNAIPAANSIGQGCVNVASGWRASASRALAKFERGLLLCLGYRLALSLKRKPAAAMTPATSPADMATCWNNSNRRHQRHQRWMSGVVVDPGTVGVC